VTSGNGSLVVENLTHSCEINVINIFSPPASLEQTSEQDRELLAINGIDLERRAETKVHFHLSSLLQIKPCVNRAAPNVGAPFIPSDF
jgi:hypothetical protein